MSEPRKLDLSLFHWLNFRWEAGRSSRIMKVTKLSEGVPQAVFGHIIDTETGRIVEAHDRGYGENVHVFACEIGDSISTEELARIVDAMHDRIGDFFDAHAPGVVPKYVPESTHVQ